MSLLRRSSRRPGSTPVIFIVDDEPAIGEMIREILALEGYESEVYVSPRAALEALSNRSVGLILLDFRMPEMTGHQFVAELEASGRRVPVVVVSGWVDKEPLAQMTNLGVFGFLEKPFLPETLLQEVRRFVPPPAAREADPPPAPFAPAAEGSEGTAPPMAAPPAALERPAIGRSGGTAFPWASPPRYWPAPVGRERHFLFDLWPALASGPAIFLVGPPGVEFELVARQAALWSGRRDSGLRLVDASAVGRDELLAWAGRDRARPPLERETLLLVTTGGEQAADALVAAAQAPAPELLRLLVWTKSPNDTRRPPVVAGLPVVEIPPLRVRRRDLAAHAVRLVRRYALAEGSPDRSTFSPGVLTALLGYDWPGNYDQLARVLRRVMHRPGRDAIGPQDLDAVWRRPGEGPTAPSWAELLRNEQVDYVRRVAATVPQRTDLARLLDVTEDELGLLLAGGEAEVPARIAADLV